MAVIQTKTHRQELTGQVVFLVGESKRLKHSQEAQAIHKLLARKAELYLEDLIISPVEQVPVLQGKIQALRELLAIYE